MGRRLSSTFDFVKDALSAALLGFVLLALIRLWFAFMESYRPFATHISVALSLAISATVFLFLRKGWLTRPIVNVTNSASILLLLGMLGFFMSNYRWWSRLPPPKMLAKSYSAYFTPTDDSLTKFTVEEKVTLVFAPVFAEREKLDDKKEYPVLISRTVDTTEAGWYLNEVSLRPLDAEFSDQLPHGLTVYEVDADVEDAKVIVYDLPKQSFFESSDGKADTFASGKKETAKWTVPRVTKSRPIRFTFLKEEYVNRKFWSDSFARVGSYLDFVLACLGIVWVWVGILLSLVLVPLLTVFFKDRASIWYKKWVSKPRKLEKDVRETFAGLKGEGDVVDRVQSAQVKSNDKGEYSLAVELNAKWDGTAEDTLRAIKRDMVKVYSVAFQSKAVQIETATVKAHLPDPDPAKRGPGQQWTCVFETSLDKLKATSVTWANSDNLLWEDIWTKMLHHVWLGGRPQGT